MATAADLIRDSYYLAQVLDPNEEIEGFEASEGTYQLNRIIDIWGSLSRFIPSYTILTIAVSANVYTYNITPVITQLSEAHILDIYNNQFTLNQIDLQRFNTLNFALSAESPVRPHSIFIQNDFANWPTLSKVILFPVPDNTYTVTLYVMQRLANVEYSDDLSDVPAYWIAGLQYELAKQLINIYKTSPSATFEKDYEDAIQNLTAANKRDNSVQIRNPFLERWRHRPWGYYVD